MALSTPETTPIASSRPRFGECSSQHDAHRHPERQPRHDEAGCDIEAADPAPQDTARDGDGDDRGEQRPSGHEIVAKRGEISHEIGDEDRLKAVEREAGEGKRTQVLTPSARL